LPSCHPAWPYDGLDYDGFAFGDPRFLAVLDDRDLARKLAFQEFEHIAVFLFLRAAARVIGLATYPAMFAWRLLITGLVALFVDAGRTAEAVRVVGINFIYMSSPAAL
jgi:hypothetical protein